MLAASSVVRAQDLSRGLVAHYIFDGNAADVSGSRNHATVGGAHAFLPNGENGSAIRLFGDGALVYSGGGYVVLPSFDATYNDGFTISLWAKDEVLGGEPAHEEAYISFGILDQPGCGILYNSVTRRLIYQIDGGAGRGDIQLPINAPAALALWKHLAITYRPGHFIAYYNGVKVAEPYFTVNAFPVTRAALGRHWWSGGTTSSARMSVTLDNVRVYNRALSETEMSQLFHAESAQPPVTVPPQPPAITLQPRTQTIIEGQSVTFRVTATGSAPLAYQWLKNGNAIAGASESSYFISAVEPSDAAAYSVSVSNAAGSLLSASASLTVVPANPGRLINLSVLGTGDFTIGFTLGGASSKAVLLRAVGPTLTRFRVASPATSTALTLYSGASVLAQNSGWGSAANATHIAGVGGAFRLDSGSADSAILITLNPGSYTTQVMANGQVLLEVYEVP